MSKSHYIIEDVQNIYASIHEETESVEEIDNFAGDVYSAVATSMLHEGYSASGVLGFLSTASDEEILERFGDFDENFIAESTISEEYVNEQVEQLDEFVGAALRVLGGGLKAAKYAKPGLLSKLGQGLQGAGRATSRVAQQGPKASSVVRAGLSKVKSAAGAGLSKLKGAATKVGGAVKGAVTKAAPAVTGALKGAAKMALPAAAGFALGRATAPKAEAPKATAPATPATPKPAAPKPAAPTAQERAYGPRSTLNKDQQAVNKEYDRLRKSGDMAGAAAYGKRMAAAGASKSDFKMPKETKKESYDLVLDYLLSGGHADTIEEAHYIMLRLEADHVQEIVEQSSTRSMADQVTDALPWNRNTKYTTKGELRKPGENVHGQQTGRRPTRTSSMTSDGKPK